MKQENGQDMMEYALLIGIVVVMAAVGLTSAHGGIGGLFDSNENVLVAWLSSAPIY